MSPQLQFCLPGLPEGVRALRWGTPDPGEYVYTGCDVSRIGKGLVVTLEPGWSLEWDPARAQNVLTRPFDEPKRVTILMRNPLEEQRIREALASGALAEA